MHNINSVLIQKGHFCLISPCCRTSQNNSTFGGTSSSGQWKAIKKMDEGSYCLSFPKGDLADFQAGKSGAKVSQMFILNPQG